MMTDVQCSQKNDNLYKFVCRRHAVGILYFLLLVLKRWREWYREMRHCLVDRQLFRVMLWRMFSSRQAVSRHPVRREIANGANTPRKSNRKHLQQISYFYNDKYRFKQKTRHTVWRKGKPSTRREGPPPRGWRYVIFSKNEYFYWMNNQIFFWMNIFF